MTGKVTYLVVLTEDQRDVLLKYNVENFRDQFESDEDFETYKTALDKIHGAKGMVPQREPAKAV